MPAGKASATDDPLLAVIEPALRVGAASGGAGFVIGGAAGIVRSATPTLFAIASSIQCATLGTTYWATRGLVLQAWDPGNSASVPAELTTASGLAGSISGGLVGLLFRGPRNVLPGIICIGAFGAGSQAIYNSWTRDRSRKEPREGFWHSLSRKSWSPLRYVSDEEYDNMLRDKLLKIEVDISLLDDKIAALRKQETQRAYATDDLGGY